MALLIGVVSLIGLGAGPWISWRNGPNVQDMRIAKITHSGMVTDVTISPDGRYVVYAKLEGDKKGLWLHQVATQSDVQILSPDTGFHGLTFSPSGDYIYFVHRRSRLVPNCAFTIPLSIF